MSILDTAEKEINEGELVILNALQSLVGYYTLPNHIKESVNKLISQLMEDVDNIDNDSEIDFEDVKLIRRAYYVMK